MRVTFHGAAGEVTGSKHLVELAGSRILLDCGAFQGRRRESREKNLNLPFDAGTVDAVIVSHAHFDHVGMLPLLVKHGFRGRIYSTAATRDLTELILLDAAHIQEQDAAYQNRHKVPEAELAEPLYTQDDIPNVMELFTAVPYVTHNPAWQVVTPTVKLKLYDAGHILGSAVSVLEGTQNGKTERLAYTGDLGRPDQPLLRDPTPIQDPVDLAIIESTYGMRKHHPISRAEAQLKEAVLTAVKTKGRILVPAFSMGRTQELVYLLHEMTDRGDIPRVPVFVDSPLASRITKVFTQHQHEYDKESKTDFRLPGEDPLAFRNLTYTQSVDESKALIHQPGPCIIISASGMLSGGRILHHLKNHLEDPSTIVLFTGFQAEHTPGRRMIKGAEHIQIFGRMIPVKADLRTVNDLSAHADIDDILHHLQAIPAGPTHIALVHGEDDRRLPMADYLKAVRSDWTVHIPQRDESLQIP